jgi:hypothetical protein
MRRIIQGTTGMVHIANKGGLKGPYKLVIGFI